MNDPLTRLPPDITVFERGWLSSNNILLRGAQSTALIDSGYASHAAQTVALVHAALGGRALDLLVNTHLHSDHCGGNAALQAAWPAMQTAIPPGLAPHVSAWDPVALTYAPTGQSCPQFRFEALLQPGSEIRLGDRPWQIHAAPGHDTHSVILFEPAGAHPGLGRRAVGARLRRGVPRAGGRRRVRRAGRDPGPDRVAGPRHRDPGARRGLHRCGRAIAFARERLNGFLANPAKHTRHAAKVLLKFKLLEVQQPELCRFHCLGAGHARTST